MNVRKCRCCGEPFASPKPGSFCDDCYLDQYDRDNSLEAGACNEWDIIFVTTLYKLSAGNWVQLKGSNWSESMDSYLRNLAYAGFNPVNAITGEPIKI